MMPADGCLGVCALAVLARPGLEAQAPAGRRGANPASRSWISITPPSTATSQAIFGQNIDVGKGVTDLLVTMLVKDGTYSVIERKALDKILAEQNFSNSDRADPTSAAKIGKLLGVDAIIVGSITQFGNDTKNTGVGGVGAGLGKVGLGGFSQQGEQGHRRDRLPGSSTSTPARSSPSPKARANRSARARR